MQAYEFHAMVENGTIQIPNEYKSKIGPKVKVIVLSSEKPVEKKKNLILPAIISTKGFKFDREEANER